MSYYRKLAFELRMRGQSEGKVEDVLREVDEFVRTSGSGPEAEFGSAAELAARYPKVRRMTAGHRIFMAAVVAAVVLYFANLLLRDSGNVSIATWAMWLILFMLVVVASVIATRVNRRLPKSLARLDRNTS